MTKMHKNMLFAFMVAGGVAAAFYMLASHLFFDMPLGVRICCSLGLWCGTGGVNAYQEYKNAKLAERIEQAAANNRSLANSLKRLGGNQ